MIHLYLNSQNHFQVRQKTSSHSEWLSNKEDPLTQASVWCDFLLNCALFCSLFAPVFNFCFFVGFNYICDVHFWIHLLAIPVKIQFFEICLLTFSCDIISDKRKSMLFHSKVRHFLSP